MPVAGVYAGKTSVDRIVRSVLMPAILMAHTRANVASLTTTSQRLRYLTIIAATIFTGYAVTPGLGIALSFVDVYIGGFHLSPYTAPGA